MSPNTLPSGRFGSAHGSARRSGRAYRFAYRTDRSVVSGEHAEEHPSDGLPNSVRVEQGGPPGG